MIYNYISLDLLTSYITSFLGKTSLLQDILKIKGIFIDSIFGENSHNTYSLIPRVQICDLFHIISHNIVTINIYNSQTDN